MSFLLQLFKDICLFKKGPEDTPSSINLLIFLFITNLFSEIILGLSVYSLSFIMSAILSIISVVVLVLYTVFWLYIFKLKSRILQTITAFLGISLFMNVCFLLPMLTLWKLNIISESTFGFSTIIFLMWSLSIYVHIYKNALSISLFQSIALTITSFILINTISINITGA